MDYVTKLKIFQKRQPETLTMVTVIYSQLKYTTSDLVYVSQLSLLKLHIYNIPFADLMLSELDDWMSDDGSDGDEDKEGDDDDDDDDGMKKKKKVQAKGRKQHGKLIFFPPRFACIRFNFFQAKHVIESDEKSSAGADSSEDEHLPGVS